MGGVCFLLIDEDLLTGVIVYSCQCTECVETCTVAVTTTPGNGGWGTGCIGGCDRAGGSCTVTGNGDHGVVKMIEHPITGQEVQVKYFERECICQ